MRCQVLLVTLFSKTIFSSSKSELPHWLGDTPKGQLGLGGLIQLLAVADTWALAALI